MSPLQFLYLLNLMKKTLEPILKDGFEDGGGSYDDESYYQNFLETMRETAEENEFGAWVQTIDIKYVEKYNKTHKEKIDTDTITCAYSFFETLDLYNKKSYDLFLLDINLPDGNGIKLCERIREKFETPILFLTANDTEEDMLAGFKAGCDDYIAKPFSIEVLRKKVQAVLKRTVSLKCQDLKAV